MTQRRNSIKRWSWLALFGFAWVQLGLVAHLSLVAHDIDARGHTVHSHQVHNRSAQRHDRHVDASQKPTRPDKKSPIANEDCQVLHFIEHSSGLIFTASTALTSQLVFAVQRADFLRLQLRFDRQRYRLSPAQSPPQTQLS